MASKQRIFPGLRMGLSLIGCSAFAYGSSSSSVRGNCHSHQYCSNDAATDKGEMASCRDQMVSMRKSASFQDAKLIFVGTGSSTGCPRPLCALLKELPNSAKADGDELDEMREKMQSRCEVSRLAIKGNPKDNKNYRNNPSIVISYELESISSVKRRYNVIFDVGKTFREGAIRWLPSNGVEKLDAIILTHDHFDAIGGLDDVRGFQYCLGRSDYGTPIFQQIPVYLSKSCFEGVKSRFAYLVPDLSKNTGSIQRAVAALGFKQIEEFKPFEAAPGLIVTPLPVLHGEDYVCFGYAFNAGDTNILYLSDLSRMPEDTLRFITAQLPPTDVIIVDALNLKRKHNTHFNLVQAIELIEVIQPRAAAYVVGMNCDDFPEHDTMNKLLKDKYANIPIQLAHDGLVLPL